MFGKTQNGAAVKVAGTTRGAEMAGRRAGDAEGLFNGLPNRYEIRAWTFEHPWLALGGGLAAGYFATRAWSEIEHFLAFAARTKPRPKTFANPRAFRRASAALWLIPLFELAQFGLEMANAYREPMLDE